MAPRARAFAAQAYDSSQELEHPTEVATLVGSGDDELYAAALLHDLVEDTDVQLPEIAREFGPRVAALVEAMTEDGSISDYRERKEEARCRVRDSGRDAALLFVADKLSNARRMRAAKKEPDARKIAHYGATLETMRAAYPDLPLLPELQEELEIREATGPVPQPGARA
jgi:(p)ppGpp synthase/HD superfamily hydrolase